MSLIFYYERESNMELTKDNYAYYYYGKELVKNGRNTMHGYDTYGYDRHGYGIIDKDKDLKVIGFIDYYYSTTTMYETGSIEEIFEEKNLGHKLVLSDINNQYYIITLSNKDYFRDELNWSPARQGSMYIEKTDINILDKLEYFSNCPLYLPSFIIDDINITRLKFENLFFKFVYLEYEEWFHLGGYTLNESYFFSLKKLKFNILLNHELAEHIFDYYRLQAIVINCNKELEQLGRKNICMQEILKNYHETPIDHLDKPLDERIKILTELGLESLILM